MLVSLLLVSLLGVLAERTWPVRDSATLLQVVAQAEAGDVVEMEPGDYVFSTPLASSGMAPILISKPLTLRSRDKRQRAVLHNDGSSLLIAVTSSMVTLSDFVVGKQRSGGDERSIDILFGAGTQNKPASADAYNGAAALVGLGSGNPDLRKRGGVHNLGSSRKEIIVARGIHTASDAPARLRKRAAEVLAEGSMHVLHDLKLENVDFGASRSGANVAFASGSYATVDISGCSFGREQAPHINALVTVGDALFTAFSVHANTFMGGAHVLIGSPAVETSALSMNFWGSDKPAVYIGGNDAAPEVYCLDAECTRLAPIVDADNTNKAYATLEEAVAEAQNVMITDDITLTKPVVFWRPMSTLQGAASCNGAPLIRVMSGASIVSMDGALSGVRNVRMSLQGPGAAGFVYSDNTAQRLGVAKFVESLLIQFVPQYFLSVDPNSNKALVMLFDGVSILGTQTKDQVGLLLNDAKIRVELEDTVMLQLEYGVVAHRGALAVVDSTFFAASASAIYAETITHQAALRVSGSTFIGCERAAIELGAGASSNTLREFYISCSQFLFNKRRNPIVASDCARKPTLCASALRYNTIISDFPPSTEDDNANTLAAAERRMLKQGANHVEHGRSRDDYVYFGDATQTFALQDKQGRFSWVTGTLSGDALSAAFLLASYAPMRAECFGVDGISPEASVISDVLEVRSDSMLHSCSSLAARFRIDDATTLSPTLAVYGVSSLGDTSDWVQAISVTHAAGGNNQATIESSIVVHNVDDDLHTHRIVVVALETMPEKLAAALSSGSATINDVQRAIARRLCVVCSGTLPTHLLDEFCGGSTDNVRASFDAAYNELGFGATTGAPRANAASIYIYGTCETALCPVDLDQNENIEGTSITVRGTLKQSAKCTDRPLIRFTPRASVQSSIRYLVAKSNTDVTVAITAPASASTTGSPSLAYCSISDGVTIDSRNGGRIIGNDFGGAGSAQRHIAVTNTRATEPTMSLIIEANTFANYGLEFKGAGEVRIDRNRFDNGGALRGEGSGGQFLLTANDGLRIVDAGQNSLTAIGNSVPVDLTLSLSKDQSYTGSSETLQGAAITMDGSARLSSVRLDASSTVMVVGGSVVIRDVTFEEIGTGLATKRAFALCAHFELDSTGIDLSRSLIYNGAGKVVLLDEEQRQMAGDPTLFWALDGTLSRCTDSKPPVRGDDYCGCENDRATPGATTTSITTNKSSTPKPNILIQARPAAINKAVIVQQDAVGDNVALATTSVNSGTLTLIIIFSVLAGLLIICLVVACCIYAARRSSVTRISAMNARQSLGTYHHPQYQPAVQPIVESGAALGALNLRHRTPTVANK